MVEKKIEGVGCAGSASQPKVECSPTDKPCDVLIVIGKGGKLRIRESA